MGDLYSSKVALYTQVVLYTADRTFLSVRHVKIKLKKSPSLFSPVTSESTNTVNTYLTTRHGKIALIAAHLREGVILMVTV